MKGLK